MTTTTFERTTFGIKIDEHELETTFHADEYMDSVLEVREDGTLELRYAVHDDHYEWSPLKDLDWAGFQEFSNEWERNQFFQEKEGEGYHCYLVNHFEHSLSSYSVIAPENLTVVSLCEDCGMVISEREGVLAESTNDTCLHDQWTPVTRNEGYRGGWDDRPSGVVYVKPDGENGTQAQAESLMGEYTAWAQGEVYMLVRETYTAEGDPIDFDTCSGFIGSDYAQQTLTLNEF